MWDDFWVRFWGTWETWEVLWELGETRFFGIPLWFLCAVCCFAFCFSASIIHTVHGVIRTIKLVKNRRKARDQEIH